MSNVLILNITIPYPANYNGNTIRVLPLSIELAKEHNCFLAVFDDDMDRLAGLQQAGVYQDILLLPKNTYANSPFRHLFIRTGNTFRRSSPEYYSEVVSMLRDYIEQNKIDIVIAHTLSASEFVQPFNTISKIVDDIDCRTLSLTRRHKYEGKSASIKEKLGNYRELMRSHYQESRLLKYFDYITTISPVDRQMLADLNHAVTDKVVDVPNGFLPELIDYEVTGEMIPNSIAFWGALDFPPNNSAVKYFFENVYEPFLSDKDIKWYVIGRNASEDIIAMGEKYKNIKVTGYVDDLFGLVSQIPIMINPMKMGGGLKNKVLEAFALGRLVISNEMGMEAVPAEEGKHYVLANEPVEFAEKISEYLIDVDKRDSMGLEAQEFVRSNYSWGALGARYNQLIQSALDQDID